MLELVQVVLISWTYFEVRFFLTQRSCDAPLEMILLFLQLSFFIYREIYMKTRPLFLKSYAFLFLFE